MATTSSAAFADTKKHYHLLDGLRGVAALIVMWYHVFEGYAFAGNTMIENFNHGYLAVDFFFMLSGFVISYAYDDRWGGSFTMKDFFKRRLIRLHPMVIMGGCVRSYHLLHSRKRAMGRNAHRHIHDDAGAALYDVSHSRSAGCRPRNPWKQRNVSTERSVLVVVL